MLGLIDNCVFQPLMEVKMHKKVLAVALPGICSMACFYRRNDANAKDEVGNADAVIAAVQRHIEDAAEVYLTGYGEPGLSSAFRPVLELIRRHGVPFSILSATRQSIVAGARRFEVSLSAHSKKAKTDHSEPLRALEQAAALGIPRVLSITKTKESDDDPLLAPIISDPEWAMRHYDAVGVIIRPQQFEGRSDARIGGHAVVLERGNVDKGMFPVAAYPELQELGRWPLPLCIDHHGKLRPSLRELSSELV